MPLAPRFCSAPHWSELGEGFSDSVSPAVFPEHRLRFRNDRWAKQIGVDTLTSQEWEQHFAAFLPLPENIEAPQAVRYHGHQFRVYNPDLGDGRGFLFAQVRDEARRLLDLGTKGSGQTPWSRQGDGRLTLKGGVREILATEMLEALGVYTSKSFSLFETGESLWRGDEPSPTRSAVLVRLGHSHVRLGCFQRLKAIGDEQRLRKLLDYAVEYYAPEAASSDDSSAAFLAIVASRSARLCASWMAAGFVHGVLNTDNMNVTGESFDYGPWRFLPNYDPNFTAAYFDQTGLYAYGRQPDAVFWNLQRFAETLLDMSTEAALRAALDGFVSEFFRHYREAILRRLGLASSGDDRDADFLTLFRAFMSESGIGYDRFFFDWWGGEVSVGRAAEGAVGKSYNSSAFKPLRKALGEREPLDASRIDEAWFQQDAPCTLSIDEVEAIWTPIAERDDWRPFDEKIAAIRRMGETLRLEQTADAL